MPPSALHVLLYGEKKSDIGSLVNLVIVTNGVFLFVCVLGWNGEPENHGKGSKARRRFRILETSLRQRNPVKTSKLLGKE